MEFLEYCLYGEQKGEPKVVGEEWRHPPEPTNGEELGLFSCGNKTILNTTHLKKIIIIVKQTY